jgi:hypothetical protein
LTRSATEEGYRRAKQEAELEKSNWMKAAFKFFEQKKMQASMTSKTTLPASIIPSTTTSEDLEVTRLRERVSLRFELESIILAGEFSEKIQVKELEEQIKNGPQTNDFSLISFLSGKFQRNFCTILFSAHCCTAPAPKTDLRTSGEKFIFSTNQNIFPPKRKFEGGESVQDL